MRLGVKRSAIGPQMENACGASVFHPLAKVRLSGQKAKSDMHFSMMATSIIRVRTFIIILCARIKKEALPPWGTPLMIELVNCYVLFCIHGETLQTVVVRTISSSFNSYSDAQILGRNCSIERIVIASTALPCQFVAFERAAVHP